ncbi:DMT family transporter [Rhodococcus sp. 14-2470-1a]|uniref:DMT family transporter n=1 Tax=Rhodococcus sp. 14-2470-1a TaxID=2023150 RepID=UPI000B9BBBD0|nr:DMT family transporter [Rhodococcus sp. 14-2470-1a]OZF48468.1 EamA family transporter [Rhodococcus sp. 14-2470-1a]
MSPHSSATCNRASAISYVPGPGILWGLVGVVAFSLTVPLTRVAVLGGMPALFAGVGRAVVAAALAVLVLGATRQRLPNGMQWARLAVIASGVVVGFPLLTSYALTTASASHSAIVIALLPATTAVVAVARGKEKVRTAFWLMAVLGATAALGFSVVRSGGWSVPQWSDLLLLAAVVSAAIGYAEGGLLSRELGSWQTVSWALIVALPVTVPLTLLSLDGLSEIEPKAWAAFGYLASISMYLGFFAWYRGLAIGPITNVSQVQLVQPVLSLGWAAVILHEYLSWSSALGGAVVVVCAAMTVRTRSSPERLRARK